MPKVTLRIQAPTCRRSVGSGADADNVSALRSATAAQRPCSLPRHKQGGTVCRWLTVVNNAPRRDEVETEAYILLSVKRKAKEHRPVYGPGRLWPAN